MTSSFFIRETIFLFFLRKKKNLESENFLRKKEELAPRVSISNQASSVKILIMTDQIFLGIVERKRCFLSLLSEDARRLQWNCGCCRHGFKSRRLHHCRDAAFSTSHFSQLHECLPHSSHVFCYLGPGVCSKSSHLKLNDKLNKPWPW